MHKLNRNFVYFVSFWCSFFEWNFYFDGKGWVQNGLWAILYFSIVKTLNRTHLQIEDPIRSKFSDESSLPSTWVTITKRWMGVLRFNLENQFYFLWINKLHIRIGGPMDNNNFNILWLRDYEQKWQNRSKEIYISLWFHLYFYEKQSTSKVWQKRNKSRISCK